MRTPPIASPSPFIEPLESRQLMSSTTPFLSNDCLPPAPSAPPPPSAHHHRPTPSTTPAAPAPTPTPRPTPASVAGMWSGQAFRTNVTFISPLSLAITRNAGGDLFATLKFDRFDDTPVSVKAQVTLAADGRFSLQSLSPKLVVRMDGTFNPSAGETGGMSGNVQYWTPAGTGRYTFNLFKQNSIVIAA